MPKVTTIGVYKLKELEVNSDADVVLEIELKKRLYGLKQAGRLWS